MIAVEAPGGQGATKAHTAGWIGREIDRLTHSRALSGLGTLRVSARPRSSEALQQKPTPDYVWVAVLKLPSAVGDFNRLSSGGAFASRRRHFD
jgi:hypothetical protein